MKKTIGHDIKKARKVVCFGYGGTQAVVGIQLNKSFDKHYVYIVPLNENYAKLEDILIYLAMDKDFISYVNKAMKEKGKSYRSNVFQVKVDSYDNKTDISLIEKEYVDMGFYRPVEQARICCTGEQLYRFIRTKEEGYNKTYSIDAFDLADIMIELNILDLMSIEENGKHMHYAVLPSEKTKTKWYEVVCCELNPEDYDVAEGDKQRSPLSSRSKTLTKGVDKTMEQIQQLLNKYNLDFIIEVLADRVVDYYDYCAQFEEQNTDQEDHCLYPRGFGQALEDALELVKQLKQLKDRM